MLSLAAIILVTIALGYILGGSLQSSYAYLLAGFLGALTAIGLVLMISAIHQTDIAYLQEAGPWPMRGLLVVGLLASMAGVLLNRLMRET